mmetsp:Transcript_60957/g.96753  ORF Transcript_60957/g.96753 Transcript_60957/m.96753 type:complete len:126 (-) Transcript_60957:126-503(-)
MVRTIAIVFASLACMSHGRETELDQMQQLAMHLLVMNPSAARSSTRIRSSMVPMYGGLSGSDKRNTNDKSGGKTKYGVPIYLESGDVNPAYLEAERKEKQAKINKDLKELSDKRKKLLKEKKLFD